MPGKYVTRKVIKSQTPNLICYAMHIKIEFTKLDENSYP